MFSKLFTRQTPKPKPRTKVQRREQMLQRLRVKHPDWSDAKLLHYAATHAAQSVITERSQARARIAADFAAVVADGAKLAARVDAGIASAQALVQRSIVVPLDDGSTWPMSLLDFLDLQRELAECVRAGKPWSDDGSERDRALLAEVNRVAVEHGLAEAL